MERLPRSWQDLNKVTMVCHGSYQEYQVKNSIKPFSVIDRVPTNWKACLQKENGIVSETMLSKPIRSLKMI